MPEAKSYSGACHCGAVAYTVEIDPSQALKCNCTICTKIGAVWAFAPKSRFKLDKGADRQGDYQFNKKQLHHRFCAVCGVESYAEGTAPDGSPTVGINLRCVEASMSIGSAHVHGTAAVCRLALRGMEGSQCC